MRTKETAVTLTATSPAAASTTIGQTVSGYLFSRAEKMVVDAFLAGGTGGTLDVYLQRRTAANEWLDWVHFPQIAALAAKKYTLTITGDGPWVGSALITEVGGGTDAAPAPLLAANTAVNCIPGSDLRLVFVAGAGTTAGASNRVVITPYTERN